MNSFGITPPPLNIHFNGLGEFRPTDDITPLEAVRLCQMMACATAGSWGDYVGFAKEHGLDRHFRSAPSTVLASDDKPL